MWQKEEGLLGKLVVLRHLKTQDGFEARFCSGERDISILPGQTIAPETVQEIKEIREVVKGLYALAHTGLVRTRQTAWLLGQALGYSRKVFVFPEFRERLGGKLAGLQFGEIQKIFPNLREPQELWTIVEASELGLESVDTFLARIENGLRKISAFQESVLLIAHAGAIKGIRAVLETETPEEKRRILASRTPENAEIEYFWSGKGP